MKYIFILIVALILIVGCMSDEPKTTIVVNHPTTKGGSDSNDAFLRLNQSPAQTIYGGTPLFTSGIETNYTKLQNGPVSVNLSYAGVTDQNAFLPDQWTGTIGYVEYGGTGRNSIPAYANIFGGLTNISPIQTVTACGAGKILRGAGVSALPACTTTTYPNTIASTYVIYATNTNAIGGTADLTFTPGAGPLLNIGSGASGGNPAIKFTPVATAGADTVTIGSTGANFTIKWQTSANVPFSTNPNGDINMGVKQKLTSNLAGLDNTGDGNFHADMTVDNNLSGSLFYGGIGGDDFSRPRTITVAGTYYDINAQRIQDWNWDLNNGFVQGTGADINRIIATTPGVYLVNWSMTIHSATASQVIGGLIGINNKPIIRCENTSDSGNANQMQSIGGTCFIRVTSTDKLHLMLENETGTNTVVISHMNLSLVRVGN